MDEEIFGIHSVYEALESGARPIERIYVSREPGASKVRRIQELARQRGIPVRRETRSVLDRLVGGEAHQGVVAITGVVEYRSLEELMGFPDAVLVILDEVQDPQNLGAVIRTAEVSGAAVVRQPV